MSSTIVFRNSSLRALTGLRQLPPFALKSSRAFHGSRPSALVRPQLGQQKAVVPFIKLNVIAWKRNYAIDRKAEEEIGKRKLEAHPEQVSLGSSTSHIRNQAPRQDNQQSMKSGIGSDLETVKETFSLKEVPTEVLNIGLLGVVPYLATSLSSAYLAWDINYSIHNGMGIIFQQGTAEWLLHAVQPIQIGYGALILSFLGAIHWGLEFAGYGGYHYYRRYAIGVVTTIAAWPTVLLPIESALISQFIIFTGLYFVDTNAARAGWAPPWYSIYRFMLTFIVGASIVLTLVSRGQVYDKHGKMPSAVEKLQELKDQDWEALEEEEKERLHKLKMEEEGENEDEDEGDDENDDEKKEKKKGDKKGKAEKKGEDEEESDDEGDDEGDDDKKEQKDKKDQKKKKQEQDEKEKKEKKDQKDQAEKKEKEEKEEKDTKKEKKEDSSHDNEDEGGDDQPGGENGPDTELSKKTSEKPGKVTKKPSTGKRG